MGDVWAWLTVQPEPEMVMDLSSAVSTVFTVFALFGAGAWWGYGRGVVETEQRWSDAVAKKGAAVDVPGRSNLLGIDVQWREGSPFAPPPPPPEQTTAPVDDLRQSNAYIESIGAKAYADSAPDARTDIDGSRRWFRSHPEERRSFLRLHDYDPVTGMSASIEESMHWSRPEFPGAQQAVDEHLAGILRQIEIADRTTLMGLLFTAGYRPSDYAHLSDENVRRHLRGHYS